MPKRDSSNDSRAADTKTGDEVFPLSRFSPDGKTLITFSGTRQGGVFLTAWDVAQKRIRSRLRWKRAGMPIPCLSNDAKTLVTLNLGDWSEFGDSVPIKTAIAQHWDVATGKKLSEFKISKIPIWTVAMSPDGKMLATGSGSTYPERKPGEVNLWEIRTGRLLKTFKEKEAIITALTFSPDGKILIAGTGWPHQPGRQPVAIRVLDAGTLKQKHEIPLKLSWTKSAKFSANGRYLATLDYGRPVHIWDTKTWKLRSTIDESPTRQFDVDSIAISNDGQTLATGHTYHVRFWNAQSAKEIGSVRVPLKFGGIKELSFGAGHHLVFPTQGPRRFPWVMNCDTGLDVVWSKNRIERPQAAKTRAEKKRQRLLRESLDLVMRAIEQKKPMDPQVKTVLSTLVNSARLESTHLKLLHNLGIGNQKVIIGDGLFFVGKRAVWKSKIALADGNEVRIFIFDPTSHMSPR